MNLCTVIKRHVDNGTSIRLLPSPLLTQVILNKVYSLVPTGLGVKHLYCRYPISTFVLDIHVKTSQAEYHRAAKHRAPGAIHYNRLRVSSVKCPRVLNNLQEHRVPLHIFRHPRFSLLTDPSDPHMPELGVPRCTPSDSRQPYYNP